MMTKRQLPEGWRVRGRVLTAMIGHPNTTVATRLLASISTASEEARAFLRGHIMQPHFRQHVNAELRDIQQRMLTLRDECIGVSPDQQESGTKSSTRQSRARSNKKKQENRT